MKQAILGALLLGAVTMQTASAAIRTFDFTATIIQLRSVEDPGATTIPGPVAGTTVTAGDLLKGQFSFDDGGRDWANATDSAGGLALSYSYTLLSTNTKIEVQSVTWEHNPTAGGNYFGLSGQGTETIDSLSLGWPSGGFDWDLDQKSYATLFSRWFTPTPNDLLAELTSLTEVSPVPEPSTWGMLLVGAAVAAGAARRARRAA